MSTPVTNGTPTLKRSVNRPSWVQSPLPSPKTRSGLGSAGSSTRSRLTPSQSMKQLSSSRLRSKFSEQDSDDLANLSVSSRQSQFGGSSFGTPMPSSVSSGRTAVRGDLPPTQSMNDLRSLVNPLTAYSDSPSLPPSTSMSNIQTVRSPAPKPAATANVPTASRSFPYLNTDDQKSISTVVNGDTPSVSSDTIVVFGFPSYLIPQILDHFSQYGSVVHHRLEADRAIHITYADPASASKALTENGAKIGGFRIGCIPGSDTASSSSLHKGQPEMKELKPYETLNSALTSSSRTSTPNNALKSSPAQSLPAGNISGTPRSRFSDPRHRLSPGRLNPGSDLKPNVRRVQARRSGAIFKSKDLHRTPLSVSVVDNNSKNERWLSWLSRRAQQLIFGWDEL
ncbi:hypothetical protein CANCADRAFT_43604 [Tortispora caseinolytica NRRL Y-17796]|uniref:RRM Nup35-type domain-containing protein n=1 Tax=Tortispora caseinolytica NRRL Y-17796 TaxID=767744 RepID=A0A1E4TDQ4_9ASCO|nr:hypothetical protein CANCADRAFT_43604 [Tortispora caseinolytica NRRL Y-17796]